MVADGPSAELGTESAFHVVGDADAIEMWPKFLQERVETGFASEATPVILGFAWSISTPIVAVRRMEVQHDPAESRRSFPQDI